MREVEIGDIYNTYLNYYVLISQYSITIFFAACEDGQFMCNDQTCIEPEKKCDGTPDCANNEDEASCTTTGMHQQVELSAYDGFTKMY